MNLQWWLLVEFYSCREITNETDRFPAVSALARLFAERSFPDDNYAAGLRQANYATLSVGGYTGVQVRPIDRLPGSGLPRWRPLGHWLLLTLMLYHPGPREFFEHNGIDIWPFTLVEDPDIEILAVDPRNPYGQVKFCKLKLTCGQFTHPLALAYT